MSPRPSIIRRASAQPHVRQRLARARPGRAGDAAATVTCAVSWETALDLLADELRRVYGEHGNRGGLRRLLRLGQRRAVPPRAEPAAPVPELPRRLRAARQQLQPRHLARCCCRTSSATSTGLHRRHATCEVSARRAHRAAWSPSAGCRRRTPQRHPGGVVAHITPGPGSARRGRGLPVRLGQPAARRHPARGAGASGSRRARAPTPR